jgi:hypothetical protein
VKTIAAFALLWLVPAAAAQAPAGSNPADSQKAPAATPAKIDPDKEVVIRKLFEVQGTRKAMQDMIAAMSANMKPALANSLPPGDYREKLIDLFFQKFLADMKIDDLIEIIIPVYDKYFTKDDLVGLLQFYQTPLGRKLNSALPQVAIETQGAAAKMGEDLGRRSMLAVLAEHPDLAKALEEAGAPRN